MLAVLTLDQLRPPPDLTVSEWAEDNRVLSDEASAEPGRWRNERTPYLVGIMDAFNEPLIDDIVVKKCAQVGYTESLNNIVGYVIDNDPGPMLVVQPNLEMAKTFTTDRFDPMVKDSPALETVVSGEKSRDKSNTTFHKTFPDGHMTVIGANSSAGLKSRPIRYLLCDEIDEYPFVNQNTGDPLEKAKKRTATFRGRRKRLYGSTPSVEDASRIDELYKLSDQRKFFVPCPHCDFYQPLQHANLVWPKDEPHMAQYCCNECGTLIDESAKPNMLRAGVWRATSDKGNRGVAGFALNELYSPFVSWGEYAEAFITASKLPETLQTFVNESMGEVWSEDGTKIESEMFLERQEDYERPTDILFLTITVDTQEDRLEVYLKGWGIDHEAWAIEHKIFEGDPDQTEATEGSVWQRLTTYRRQIFELDDGRQLRVAGVVIDSGGSNTDAVYRYVASHYKRERVFAIKGVGGNVQTVGRPSRGNKRKCPVYPLGVNHLKTKLFTRLNKIKEPGPGFQHYSHRFDEEWFEQLTSERKVKRKVRGFTTIEWVKRRDRNEAWDLEVYQLAAVELLSPDMNALIERRGNELETGPNPAPDVPEPIDTDPEPEPIPKKLRKNRGPKRKRGFANRWRP